jgi:hypothetical protein
MTRLLDPTEWSQSWRRNHSGSPILYVAHPVAPRPGETIARCTNCKSEHAFAATDPVDLRHVCEHDEPVRTLGLAADVVAYNLRSALAWWRWLEGTLTEIVFAMPWFTNVTANGEGDRAKINRGLRDDAAIVQRCDGIVLCGSRVSSGMAIEAEAAKMAGLPVFQIQSAFTKIPDRSAREMMWAVIS